MTRVRSLMAGVLVAGLLAGGVASAQGPGNPQRPGGPGGRFAGPIGPGGRGIAGLPLRELKLTDAQRQQIDSILERRRAEDDSLQTKLRAAFDAQRKAMETVPVNEGAIRVAMQELSALEADAAVKAAYVRAEVWGVLTADQQATVKKLQAERDRRAAERPAPGARRGGRTNN